MLTPEDCQQIFYEGKERELKTQMRQFESGATRNTDEGKLSYVKGLSPIVLKRYLEYLAKHRKQADGKMRSWDNWKLGIGQDVYLDSRMRHEMDVWLAMDGFASEQDKAESLCAVIFNAMGQLHEVLKEQGYGQKT